MNAHKFVAEKGIERARGVVELAPQGATHLSKDTGHYVNANFEPMPAHIKEQLPSLIVIAELKQVVESVEIVERSGGFESVKAAITNYRASGDKVTFSSLEKRLADYELVESYKQVKCEVLDMVDVSPRCEVSNG